MTTTAWHMVAILGGVIIVVALAGMFIKPLSWLYTAAIVMGVFTIVALINYGDAKGNVLPIWTPTGNETPVVTPIPHSYPTIGNLV